MQFVLNAFYITTMTLGTTFNFFNLNRNAYKVLLKSGVETVQRTFTVQLVSSLTSLDLTNKEN